MVSWAAGVVQGSCREAQTWCGTVARLERRATGRACPARQRKRLRERKRPRPWTRPPNRPPRMRRGPSAAPTRRRPRRWRKRQALQQRATRTRGGGAGRRARPTGKFLEASERTREAPCELAGRRATRSTRLVLPQPGGPYRTRPTRGGRQSRAAPDFLRAAEGRDGAAGRDGRRTAARAGARANAARVRWTAPPSRRACGTPAPAPARPPPEAAPSRQRRQRVCRPSGGWRWRDRRTRL